MSALRSATSSWYTSLSWARRTGSICSLGVWLDDRSVRTTVCRTSEGKTALSTVLSRLGRRSKRFSVAHRGCVVELWTLSVSGNPTLGSTPPQLVRLSADPQRIPLQVLKGRHANLVTRKHIEVPLDLGRIHPRLYIVLVPRLPSRRSVSLMCEGGFEVFTLPAHLDAVGPTGVRPADRVAKQNEDSGIWNHAVDLAERPSYVKKYDVLMPLGLRSPEPAAADQCPVGIQRPNSPPRLSLIEIGKVVRRASLCSCKHVGVRAAVVVEARLSAAFGAPTEKKVGKVILVSGREQTRVPKAITRQGSRLGVSGFINQAAAAFGQAPRDSNT